MTVTTARQRVLAYLKKNRGVSAGQIGRALRLSAPNVRHHLSVLRSDERVVELAIQRRVGRGRPVKLFGLSEKMMGANLASLSEALLEERLAMIPASKRPAVLRSLAKRIAGTSLPVEANDPMTGRLTGALGRLNELHYQARWEAGPGGPRILPGWCPYAAIVERHPELCQMDTGLVEYLMNRPVERTRKPETGLPGTCPFAFAIR